MNCQRCNAKIVDERGVAHGKRYPIGAETVWLCLACHSDMTGRTRVAPRARVTVPAGWRQGELWND